MTFVKSNIIINTYTRGKTKSIRVLNLCMKLFIILKKKKNSYRLYGKYFKYLHDTFSVKIEKNLGKERT